MNTPTHDANAEQVEQALAMQEHMGIDAGPSEEELLEREQRRMASMDAVGQTLEGLKNEAVSYRLDFERNWTLDYWQYNGDSALPQSKDNKSGGGDTVEDHLRSNDNITRGKVLITAARLGDMLFPTSDANWDMESSPVPQLPPDLITGLVDAEGNPLAGDALAAAIREASAKACRNMRRKIRDQFEECDYSAEARAAILDACLYGTGVIRGPVLKSESRRKFDISSGAFVTSVETSTSPRAEHVPLWEFYPQPARNIEECEHAFRLHMMSKKKLRSLARSPGFDPEQIGRLLKQTPVMGALANNAMLVGMSATSRQAALDARFTVWEYNGPLPKAAIGDFLSGLLNQDLISPEDMAELVSFMEDTPLEEIECEVWFSQGVVLKMALPFMRTGERLSYYVFNYEENPDSLFGFGVAYLCRDDSVAVNQIWHAIMLNSMVSAAPQIGIIKSALTPQGGNGGSAKYDLSHTKPRVWALSDEVTDIRMAMSVFTIPNVVQQLLPVYERIKLNADEHTMTPMIAQGEPTSAVPTSSGLAMLMNAANVVMRRLAKTWDDSVTTPLVRAFYDYNMEVDVDPATLGDFKVIPKGASHLLIKDVQAQHIQFATSLFSSNPMLQQYMKPYEWAKKNLEILEIDAEGMLYTEEEVAEQQAAAGEQPDADTMKAQAQLAHAEAATKRAENEAERNQLVYDAAITDDQLRAQGREAELQSRVMMQKSQERLAMAQLALKYAEMDKDERIAMKEIFAKLHLGEIGATNQRHQIDTNTRLRAEQIVQADEKVAAQIQLEQPNVRIM